MNTLPKNIFCRYRSLDGKAAQFAKSIVFPGEFYFSNPLTFNDPFDCRPFFNLKSTNKKIQSYYSRIAKRHAPDLNREQRRAEAKRASRDRAINFTSDGKIAAFHATYQNDVTNRIGMLCLSEIWDDPLMWSHYADSHRGICLVFDSHNPFFNEAQQVVYQKNRPSINPIANDYQTMFERALLTKSDHWAYEREWRIIKYQGGAGSYKYPDDALLGIVLGSQISDVNTDMVAEWVKHRHISTAIYKANLSSREFRIDIDVL